MERKIGEIFEYDGEWYQCLPEILICVGCAFKNKTCKKIRGIRGECERASRQTDGVIFKKLKKVGEPYADYSPSGRVIYFQRYKCYQKPIDTGDIIYWADDIHISIEIKQTKEDMEEKNNAKHSNSEKIGKNLKPFDLEAAKAGKPVCTKDGRKARIICFDRNDLYPIVALIECKDGKEIVGAYSNEGKTEIYEIKGTDLMMLPEKKEGWVNVYKDGLLDTKSYPTKKEAFDKASPKDYVDTIKINWSE